MKERDDALSRLKSVDVNRNGEVKADDLMANADNDAPLWEVLKLAKKVCTAVQLRLKASFNNIKSEMHGPTCYQCL